MESEDKIDRVMAILNHWFDGSLRVDRNSEMVRQLAALAIREEAPAEAGEDVIEQLCEAMQDGVGCTEWSNNSWDRDGGVSRGLVRDAVRRILARQAALRAQPQVREAE